MLSYVLELPAEYAWVEFGIIVASFLILIAGVCWSGHKWWKIRKPAQVEAWFLENPVLEPSRERYVTSLRVPSEANIILYHLVETNDERELQNISVIVKYPDTIDILFWDQAYRDLRYGRKVISRGKHEAEIVFDVQSFVKGQKDKLPFPLLFDTRNADGTFPITLTITFSGIRKNAVEKQLKINVVKSDFSYNKELFDYGRFKP